MKIHINLSSFGRHAHFQQFLFCAHVQYFREYPKIAIWGIYINVKIWKQARQVKVTPTRGSFLLCTMIINMNNILYNNSNTGKKEHS